MVVVWFWFWHENKLQNFQKLIRFPRWERYFGRGRSFSANTVWETVLAAYGEYPPVNQCLQDDAKSENKAVIVALTKVHNNCVLFLKNFQKLFQNAPELMNLTISNV